MKKGLVLIGCFLALWVGAAVIQWYSDQPATTAPADTDILALERPSPHAYKSATLGVLKAYIGTNGLLTIDTFFADRGTNLNLYVDKGYFTNVYAPNITNIFLTVQSNLYATFLTVQSNAIFQTDLTVYSNLYATFLTVQSNAVFNSNLTVQSNLYASYLTVYSNLFTTLITVQSNAYFLQTNYENITINTNTTFNNVTYSTNLIVLGAFINTNYGVFPSASNTLAIGSGTNRWTLTLTGPGAVTNLSGVGYGTMEITASGGDRTFYLTNAAWLAIGDLTTNLAPSGAFLIPSGKIGMLDIDNITGSVKYSCAVQRAP